MKYLIDTNVLSELMKPRPDASVTRWFSSLERFTVSVITIEEIRFGLTLKRSARLERLFGELVSRYATVLPVTMDVAELAGSLRADQRSRGRSRTQADMFIAATAHSHALTLATRNVRDFVDCGIIVYDPFRQ